jgi:hypothetical protein
VALLGKGWVDNIDGGGLIPDNALIARAEAAATKALSLAPNYAPALQLLGSVHMNTNRAAQGMAECGHALALDRNLVGAHVSIGVAKMRLGRAEGN